MRLKILHVITSLDPSNGGPPRIAMRLAAGAAGLGHSVTLLSYASCPSAQKAIQQDRAGVPDFERVTCEILPDFTRIERLTARAAKRELASTLPQFNVVHLHDAWSPLARGTMALASRLGVPFVLLPNGMFDPWCLSQKRLKKQLVLNLGYRRLLNRAAFIHTGNLEEKSGVEKIGVTAPIEIIPNGIYPAEFDPLPARGQFYTKHPELNGQPYILFLSRLHHKKGLDFLAPAFAEMAAQHPQVRLVVAGPDEGAAEQFKAAIQAANLSDRVHLVGPIFGPERFLALIDSACFCLPSRQEGFSIAILEAMACARPVVISEPCHFPEVAAANAGTVAPLEISAISKALNEIFNDRQKAEQQGQNGRNLVMKRYTWPKIAAELADAYCRHFSHPNKTSGASD